MKKWYALVLAIALAIILAVGFFVKEEQGIEAGSQMSTAEMMTETEKDSSGLSEGGTEMESTEETVSTGTGFTELDIQDTVIEIEENQGVGGM